MPESIADLEKRRDLLKEIKKLSESGPDEDQMKVLDDYLDTLSRIKEFHAPDDDAITEADRYLATLTAIEDLPAPNEDEMEKASRHLATLNAIDEHPT